MTGLTTLFKFGKWPVFYKTLVTIIVIVALTLGIATFIHAGVLRARVREEVGAKMVALADGRMGFIADALVEQLVLLRTMALDSTLIAAVQAANADYSGSAAEIEDALFEINRQWLAAAESSALVQANINPALNPAVTQLLAYAETFPAHGEIFITDRYGGLVAATERLPYYYYARDTWWQAAYDTGLGAFYIGQPVYDTRVGYIALTMAAPVFSSQDGTVIGVLRSSVNIDFLSTAFATLSEEQMGVTLVNQQRLILADSHAQRVGWPIPTLWRLYPGHVAAAWFEGSYIDGSALVIGRASLRDVTIADAMMAAAIHSLDWHLFVHQSQTQAYKSIQSGIWLGMGVLALLLLGAAVAAWLMARTLTTPVRQIYTTMQRWLAGDKTQRGWVYWPDESGAVTEAFNTLVLNIEEMNAALSRRVIEREREERRRARDLETTTAIGEAISVAADVPSLAQTVTELIRERFGLYYVGLFLLDDADKWLVLHGGAGDVAPQMLAQDYRAAVGMWIVGRCVVEGKTISARHTDADSALLFDRAQFPYTHAAIALPLRSRGQLFGVIEAHSYQSDTFDAESAVVLQTIGDQVAVAIDRVRLYAERQETMARLQRAASAVTREAWEALLSGRAAGPEGYQAETRRIMPLPAAPPEAWRPAARAAWSEGRVVVEESAAAPAPDGAEPSLALPIRLRDEIIGVVDVSKRRDAEAWKPDEIAQLEQLVEQLGLTLEVSRFYQESRRAAAREQLLREVSERIRVAVDIDTVMRVAAQEVGAVLKRPVFVYMENEAAAEGRNTDE